MSGATTVLHKLRKALKMFDGLRREWNLVFHHFEASFISGLS